LELEDHAVVQTGATTDVLEHLAEVQQAAREVVNSVIG
jgi:hypothetical protein